ncbi:MAG: tRNA lysidine(34) synthetase TilS [Alphaproteobacteria bacterium]|nr:tRNA lysidine(34) synthetase TilS [Alphaproteobacteria bacterium]
MQEFFAKHHLKAQKIAVAVSGGADSLALVLMAKEELTVFGFEIVALTVNHHLRLNATAEAEYVAKVMKTHNIEHHILDWRENKPRTGIEEAARTARYHLLTQWCKQHNVHVLLTAHHQTDQAETFLMRLQRGSGLDGLCSMREIFINNGIIIARPLLHTPPEKMRLYLKNKQIEWKEDESNSNTKYLRNRIRAFLPQLEKTIGISVRNMAETANRLQSAEDYIEEQLKNLLITEVQTLTPDIFYFKYSHFLYWHSEMKFRILAHICRRQYIPRAEHILYALKKMSQQPFTGITLGGKEIFYYNENIWIVPEMRTKHKSSRKAWLEFVQKNPQYATLKIPHKARIAILENTERKNDL